jgi:cobalt/nickel transport system permease protein
MFYSPVQMHIPDGFLSVWVSLVLWAISIVAVGYALKRVGKDLGERQVPLMGVLAAAIFAGQMLNFTVAGGTSGHLMGAALAMILLGPWAGMLILTCVVSIQALIFQDGGLLALGANIFNMGLVGVAVAYMAYHTVRKISHGRTWGLFAGGFVAAWLSIEVASLAVALQLALSGTSPANIAIPAMGGVHALIGIGEGLITAGALAFLYASRRDLLEFSQEGTVKGGLVWVFGLLIALGLAVASPLASTHPDGLEWVAKQKGFLSLTQGPVYRLLPDYSFPGFSGAALGTILAGVLGTLMVFAAALGVAYTRRNRSSSPSS